MIPRSALTVPSIHCIGSSSLGEDSPLICSAIITPGLSISRTCSCSVESFAYFLSLMIRILRYPILYLCTSPIHRIQFHISLSNCLFLPPPGVVDTRFFLYFHCPYLFLLLCCCQDTPSKFVYHCHHMVLSVCCNLASACSNLSGNIFRLFIQEANLSYSLHQTVLLLPARGTISNVRKGFNNDNQISSLKKMRSTIVRAKRTIWAKLFPEIDDVEQKISFNVITISQKYGILFVALGNVVKMFPTSFVHGIVENFEYRISETYAILESTSISVQNSVTCIQCNCAGNRLAICVDDGGTPAAFIYEIENINSTSKHIARIQISCGHSTGLKDFRWNPNLTECFSVVLNDGTLSVMKTKNNKFRLVGKTTTTDILCCVFFVCLTAWEPLGKRLVAGLSNGKFSIYSVTLNQCSTFDPPPNLPASKFSVIDAIWFNNSEVLLVYAAVDDRKQTFLVQATVSDHKPPSISYGPLIDIQPQIFIDSFPNCSRLAFIVVVFRNVLLYSSTVGCEVVVLIRDVDSKNWTRCVETESDDDYLVFPTDLYKGDFSAVGMVFDLTNEKPTKTGEGDTFPPFPYIHVFSSEAGLISWRIELLNKRDVPFCRGVAAPQGCKLATPKLVKQSDVIVDGQIRDDNKQLSSSNTVHGHNLSLNLNAAAVNSVSSVLDLRDKSSEHISGVKSLSYIKQRTDEKLSTVSKLQISGNDPLESPDAAVALNSDDVNSLVINILSKKLTISRKHFCEPIQSKISDNLLSVLQSEVEFFQTKWNGEKERLQRLEQCCSNLRLMSVNMQAYLETMVMYLEQERDGNRYCSMQAYPLTPEQEQRMLNLQVMHDRLQAAVDDICQQVEDIRQNLNRYEDMNDPQAWSMICKSFSNIHKASELRFKKLRQLKDQLENLPFQEHCSLNTSICSKIEEWKNENSFSRIVYPPRLFETDVENKQPSVKRDAQRRLKQYVRQFREPRIIQVDPFLFECSSKDTNDEMASLFRQTFSMPQSSSVLPKEKMLFTKPTVRSPVVSKVEDAHPTVEKQQNVTTVQLSNKADLTSIGNQAVGKMPSTPSSTKDENVNFKPEVSKFVTTLKHEEPPLLTAEIAPTISVGKSLFETETKSELKPAEFKFVLPAPVQTSVEETEISETLSTVSFAGAKVSQSCEIEDKPSVKNDAILTAKLSADKANDKDEKKMVNDAAVENEMPNKTVEQAAVEQQQSADETVVDSNNSQPSAVLVDEKNEDVEKLVEEVPAVAKEENAVDMDSEVAAPPVDIFNGFSFKVNQEPSVGSDFSFCGLGGKPTPEAAVRNVFAGNTSFGTAVVSKPSSTVAQPSSLGLFGSATTFTAPSGPSLFGGQAAVCDPGPFSGGSGSESIAQKGFAVFSTSASTASVSPSAPAFGSAGASAFGGPPTFGSAPTFGGSPSFGGAPTFGASSSPSFGSPPAFGSTSPPKFGQGQGLFGSLTSFNQISQPTTGFSTYIFIYSFANANSVSFGALASTFGGASQTNPVGNTALQQQQQQPQQQQQQQQSSFTQWRG
ncbi:Nuclear pore complex protein [Trichinella murrelli]|uniref:Nuclear pore complex protein n=1 Tax=Trichinella murrelli TaxID=144512 RepID=A0A0V0U9T2_9BILA|nr:Nuclear pore complex protein [Trichinella murrelli]